MTNQSLQRCRHAASIANQRLNGEGAAFFLLFHVLLLGSSDPLGVHALAVLQRLQCLFHGNLCSRYLTLRPISDVPAIPLFTYRVHGSRSKSRSEAHATGFQHTNSLKISICIAAGSQERPYRTIHQNLHDHKSSHCCSISSIYHFQLNLLAIARHRQVSCSLPSLSSYTTTSSPTSQKAMLWRQRRHGEARAMVSPVGPSLFRPFPAGCLPAVWDDGPACEDMAR